MMEKKMKMKKKGYFIRFIYSYIQIYMILYEEIYMKILKINGYQRGG